MCLDTDSPYSAQFLCYGFQKWPFLYLTVRKSWGGGLLRVTVLVQPMSRSVWVKGTDTKSFEVEDSYYLIV